MAATAGCGVMLEQTARTFAFIAACCVSARSCNLAHSHALFFYLPNAIQSMSMTTLFFYLHSMVECMAGTAGCGAIVNEQGVR